MSGENHLSVITGERTETGFGFWQEGRTGSDGGTNQQSVQLSAAERQAGGQGKRQGLPTRPELKRGQGNGTGSMNVFQDILETLRLDEVQQAQIDSVAKTFGRTPEEVEAWARDSDPTPNFKYGPWILKQFKSGRHSPQDQNERAYIQNALSTFDRAKKTGYLRGDEGDISKFATVLDLHQKMQDVPEDALVSRRSMKRRKADPLNVPGSKVIRVSKDGEWKIIRVETPEACMFHGKGTEWCTRGSHHAGSYTSRGPLYVIYVSSLVYQPGGQVEKWRPFAQYTHDYGEVLDVNDHDIDWSELGEEIRDEVLAMMAPEPGYEDQQEAHEEYVDLAITGGGVSALAREVAEMEGAEIRDSQGYTTDNVNAGGTVDPSGLGGNTNDPMVLGNIRGFMKDYGSEPGVDLAETGGEWAYIRIDLDIDDDTMWQRILDLGDYGIWDDEAYSNAEHELIDNAWDYYHKDEFKKKLKAEVDQYEEIENAPAEEWEEAVDDMDGGDLWELLQATMEDAEVYWEFDGDSYGIDLDEIIKNIDWLKLRNDLGIEPPEERREREAQAQKAREKAAGQQFFPGMESKTQAQRDVYDLLLEQGKLVRKKVKKPDDTERVKELERELARVQRSKKRKGAQRPRLKTTNGVVLWEGPSWIDGGPIVAIMTFRPSQLFKIGDMTQVWILRSDMHPHEAKQTGADRSICGDCPHRHGSCYVTSNPTGAVWKAYRDGNYPQWQGPDRKRWDRIIASKPVRWGAYGDPALIPIEIIREVKQTLPKVKIIAISGGGRHDKRTYLQAATALGADISIEKPFEIEELLHSIERLLTNDECERNPVPRI